MSEAGKSREADSTEVAETAVEQLKEARKRLVRRNKKIAELQAQLATISAGGADTKDVRPENIVWIFCTGRSGSTWLASMMGDLEGYAVWNEPLVGELFGAFYYARAAHKKGGAGILGNRYKSVWLKSIRSMVLDGATARYPEAVENGHVVIKEPHGSVGAPLMSQALPESRIILLVRDPKDVVSSALDAQSEGSWTSKHRRWKGKKPLTEADTNPDGFVRKRAALYLRDISSSKEAYEAHGGPKALLRYEDLRADTLGEMRRALSRLGLAAGEGELSRAVRSRSWESIPEEEKGEGKFYRKAQPGGWREDLTAEQAAAVERVTAPLLREFYPEQRSNALA